MKNGWNKGARLRTMPTASLADALFVWKVKENNCSGERDDIFVQHICIDLVEIYRCRKFRFLTYHQRTN